MAATIVNVNRKKGASLVQPRDFIREPLTEEDFLSVEASRALMNSWAAEQNAIFEQQQEARPRE